MMNYDHLERVWMGPYQIDTLNQAVFENLLKGTLYTRQKI